MIEEYPDYSIRQWAIDSSITKNKKDTKIEKIIDDARKIYEFTMNIDCELFDTNKKEILNK